MHIIYKGFLAAALCAASAVVAYANEPGNLLRDYEFETPAAVWGADAAALKRGRIESFRGVYAPLNYLVCSRRQTFRQTVEVETNSDYVAGCVYLSAYDGNVSLSVPEISAKESMQSTKDWRDGRLFFNTGTNAVATVEVAARSCDGIGRIFLRKRNELDSWPDASALDSDMPLIPNGSFETGLWGYQISSREDVRYTLAARRGVSIDATTAASGAVSLKLTMPVMPTDAESSPALVQSVPFPVDVKAKYVVRFFARADGDARVTLAGTKFCDVKPDGVWQEYRTELITIRPKPQFGPSHFRLEFRIAGNGASVWLDDIAVEKVGTSHVVVAPEVGVWFDRPFKLFRQGEDARVHAAVADAGAGRFFGTVAMDVTDIDGKPVMDTVRRQCEILPGGRFAFDENVPTKLTGYYHVDISLHDGNGDVVSSNATTYAVLPQPNSFVYAQSDAGEFARLFEWGGGGDRSKGWFNVKNGASFDETLDALELMGVKWLRIMGPGQWFNTEIDPGRFEFVYDDVVARLRNRGFGVLVEMMSHGIPKWAGKRTVDHRVLRGNALPDAEVVRRYANAFARHYEGRVDAVNLINEMGGLKPEEYIDIMRAVRQGFDDAKSTICLQGPGWNLPPPDADESHWTKRAFALGLGDLTDGFGIHQYDFGHWTGDVGHLSTLPVEVRIFHKGRTWAEDVELSVKDYMERNPGKPVWDTETGNHFNTYAPWMKFPTEVKRDWYTERLAAARMIRYSVLKRSYGVTRWFHFMSMFFLQYHALDALNIDGTPRSGIAALAVFRRELDGARYLSGGRVGASRRYELVFMRPDGRRMAVAWDAEHETEPQPYVPPFAAMAFDLEWKPVKGDMIGGSPVYFLERLPSNTDATTDGVAAGGSLSL